MTQTPITIRRAEPSDYEAIHRIMSSPRVYPSLLQMPYPPLEFWRKRMTEPPEGLFNLLACAGSDVIGQLALHTFPNSPRRKHAGEIGMAVREDWQGKGAGTALMQAAVDLADRWLNLTRLELEVYVDNEVAIRLYRKFGFVIEGTLVRYAFRDGEYADTYAMARVRL